MPPPLKKRYVRANNSPFMTNTIFKAIMVRYRLRNKFLKQLRVEQHTKNKEISVSLIRDTKRQFYDNLDPKLITDSRKFRKQVTPFFSDKTPNHCDITLLEGTEIITDNTACAELLNNLLAMR